MFNIVKGTKYEKYVANPKRRDGYHNYGLAVDLTIVNEQKAPVDMGSSFDCFAPISHIGNEQYYIDNGLMTVESFHNRILLQSIMSNVGFVQNPYEWWHFQLDHEGDVAEIYKLMEF